MGNSDRVGARTAGYSWKRSRRCMKKLFLWQKRGPGQCITPHHRLAVAKSLLQNPETRVHHIPTPTTPLGGSRELAEYGWGVGAGKDCSTQGEAGHPPLPPDPAAHARNTHTLCRSVRPAEALPMSAKPVPPFQMPFQGRDPRSPHAVLLGFLGVLTSAFGAAKEKQGVEGWRGNKLSWRSAVTCFLD